MTSITVVVENQPSQQPGLEGLAPEWGLALWIEHQGQAILYDTGQSAALLGNLAALDRTLAPHPHLARLRVEGGWAVLLRRPAVDSAEACALRLLREEAVLVHPGHFFDLPGEGYLVLSLLPEPGPFQEGVRRLAAALAG